MLYDLNDKPRNEFRSKYENRVSKSLEEQEQH